ncbi:MAG: hypothetical protein ACRDWD_10995 [Acidimicrobiia bacterium]
MLLAAAAWTLFIWLARVANIVGDEDRSAGFKVVHVVLAAVSVVFAIAVGWIGINALRSDRPT